jgi:hypothetical protein
MNDKPNCYECKHRGNVPGDSHSSCKHPLNEQTLDNPLSSLIALFASVGRELPVQADTGLNVKGNPHGIENGWFNWPWNFDPVWLLSCDGFEQKGKNENDK